MPLLAITESPTGLVDVLPTFIYIATSDTYAQVTTTGYLNQAKYTGSTFNNYQMALVSTTDDGVILLQVSVSGSTVSLIEVVGPGQTLLPTIANHLIVSTNTLGTLANLTGTAINSGTLQSGLVAGGVVGSFVAYPTTTAKGFLALTAAVNGSGNFNTTISNSTTVGQTQVISIPDSGTTAANFLLTQSGGTQTIATGSLALSVGTLTLGSSGHASSLTLFPGTAANGELIIAPVNAGGAYNTTISNGTMGQSTVYTIPDVGATTGQFIVKTAALVDGNLVQASGTAGKVVDSGVTTASVSGAITQLGQLQQISVTLTAAQVIASYATPYVLIPAAAGKVAVIIAANVYTNSTGNTAFATGVAPIIQYDVTAHGAGTIAVGAGLVTGDIEAATSQIRTLGPAASTTYTGITNKAVSFSCTTAYTAGTGSTITFSLVYQLITATI